jgi:hypothetical protein
MSDCPPDIHFVLTVTSLPRLYITRKQCGLQKLWVKEQDKEKEKKKVEGE